MIRIVSKGGVVQGTEVLTEKGERLNDITAIEILPLAVNGLVEARITFAMVELDIEAHQAVQEATELDSKLLRDIRDQLKELNLRHEALTCVQDKIS